MIYPGLEIQGYVIEDEIGSGGFGRVYLVHSAKDESRKFALKLLKPELFRRPGYRQRFVNEMLNMARLSREPAIVTIHENVSFEDREGEHLGSLGIGYAFIALLVLILYLIGNGN